MHLTSTTLGPRRVFRVVCECCRFEDFTYEDRMRSERKGRYCLAEWFQLHDWLLYDRQQRAVFCDCCTKHSTLSTSSSNDVFRLGLGTGYTNWKNAVTRLGDHAQTVDHRAAYSRMIKEKAGELVSISSQLDKQLSAKQTLRRQGLISHLHTLKTLLRQGIAIRGDTDLESNVHQFRQFRQDLP